MGLGGRNGIGDLKNTLPFPKFTTKHGYSVINYKSLGGKMGWRVKPKF